MFLKKEGIEVIFIKTYATLGAHLRGKNLTPLQGVRLEGISSRGDAPGYYLLLRWGGNAFEILEVYCFVLSNPRLHPDRISMKQGEISLFGR